jgi:hypothetical protein
MSHLIGGGPDFLQGDIYYIRERQGVVMFACRQYFCWSLFEEPETGGSNADSIQFAQHPIH